MASTYRHERVAYYAFSAPYNVSFVPEGFSTPVHRFYKFKQGVHFYTASQQEATTVNNTMYGSYRYEGTPFYIINNI